MTWGNGGVSYACPTGQGARIGAAETGAVNTRLGLDPDPSLATEAGPTMDRNGSLCVARCRPAVKTSGGVR